MNIARLRIKESDRLKATVQELSKLGFDLMEKEDSILINSRKTILIIAKKLYLYLHIQTIELL